MNQFFSHLIRCLCGLGLLVLANTAKAQDPTNNLVPVGFVGSVASPTPVLLLADPGMAYIFSVPSQQMQIRIEGQSGICFDQMARTDTAGVIELPIASTRRCQQPRLVVIH